MKEIKVICDSEITIKNIKTGHVYKNEEEVKTDINAKPEDIRRDVKILVPDIPLFNKS
jgi:2-phospho-L-lactate guanylyltransferase (CobY/MobA/RfbA family)